MNAQQIAQALGGGKRSGEGWQARCPAHKDRNPSLSLSDGDSNKVLFCCHAGCEQSAVIDALKARGLWEGASGSPAGSQQPCPQKKEPWKPIFPVPDDAPRKIPPHSMGQPTEKWAYRNEDGKLFFVVCRFDKPSGGKEILPLTFCEGPGRREWRWKSFPVPRPLYGLDRLVARPDDRVLIVEGEKTADAAQKLFPDHVAVTSPGGSKAAGKADWSPLKNRRVALWPDNDKPGAGYVQDVAKFVTEAEAISVAMVDVPVAFSAGWDVADDLPDSWDADLLRKLLSEAMPIQTETGISAPGSAVETKLAELAALPRIEYEFRREGAAKEMKFRISVLDEEVAKRRPSGVDDAADAVTLFADPEPWLDPVDGNTLLDTLTGAFTRYAVLPDGAAAALALWVVHAHAHDAANISPILGLVSPEKRCGKTTVLSIIQALSPRALPAANITAAALFRVVEKWQPTVLIDEADTFLRDNDELRGVLNSGHNRATAFVVRTVGDDHDAKCFKTWSPKAIALIGNLPDTLADRAIAVRLRRKRPNETVERLRLDRMDALTVLNRQAARWADDNLDALREAEPAIPQELHDRAADNWRPLLAIADRAGGEWPKQARKVAGVLSGNDDGEDSAGVMLLADLRSIFKEQRVDRITSAGIVEVLTAMETRPWPEWRRGNPITARQVAQLLKPFGICSGTIRLTCGNTAKGYKKTTFDDAFARYLPLSSVTTSQVSDTAGFGDSTSVTSTPNVTDRKSVKPLEPNGCDGVTDENPHMGGKGGIEPEEWRAEV